MPLAIYVLGLMIFSMTTSEFMVAGIMPSLSAEFGVSIAAIGYLISSYAAGMIIGGPLLTIGLLKVPRKKAFLALSFIFLVGQTLGALAPNYELMMAARVLTGIASSACFGVAIAIALTLVRPERSGRAASIVLGGLMVATAVGLPAAMLFDQYWGWRSSFWAVDVLVLVSGLMALILIPKSTKEESASITIRSELAAFRSRHLWAAFATSMLIIGATFAAFSYFTPILTDLAGFDSQTVPLLLGIYGVATVVGNTITGRLADRHMMTILTTGLIVLTAALVLFGLLARSPVMAVAAVIVIGLSGVTMNPAMVTRVSRVSNSGALVSTFHVSVVNFGIVVGSTIGGMTIDHGFGLVSPLWVGAGLALLGLLSLLPYYNKKSAVATASPSAAETGKSCA
ncbi:MFS transporter [Cohnella thailandensis]|uniref:MFS transporter n=1 Tax=Cohnella thailandensis TaxID=557557 RepID=A0A841SMT6_9BACL|nr:MFS transporter [Cohnella thailandensis]MBB6633254.1 MFS transporter [Cohnella thailandensis]MBP1975048.1 putative MFS family arabinose efflux permease [Cohnella thailandensis]